MFQHMKIRQQMFFYIAVILTIVIALQIVLYSELRSRSDNTISAIFDSIAENTISQIKTLNFDISELSLMLSTRPAIQSSLYEYTSKQTIQNMGNIQAILDDYCARNQNIAYLGIVKDGEPFMSSSSVSFYQQVYDLFSEIEYHYGSRGLWIPSFQLDERTYFSYITPIFPINPDYYSSNPAKTLWCAYTK